MQLISFDTPRKHRGGIKRDHWHEMDRMRTDLENISRQIC